MAKALLVGLMLFVCTPVFVGAQEKMIDVICDRLAHELQPTNPCLYVQGHQVSRLKFYFTTLEVFIESQKDIRFIFMREPPYKKGFSVEPLKGHLNLSGIFLATSVSPVMYPLVSEQENSLQAVVKLLNACRKDKTCKSGKLKLPVK